MPRRGAFRGDRRGSVTVMFALAAVVVFVTAAIALDLVAIWLARRNAQAAADLSAILGAAKIDLAEATARRSLADNGYRIESVVAIIETGAYARDRQVPLATRFKPGAPAANAVRVTITTTVTTTFSRIVGLPSSFTVSATATATTANYADFTVGSGLLALDAGIANALLGALTGSTVTLKVADYAALADTKVDALRFLDAVSTSADLGVADYNRILAADVTVGQSLAALAATVPGGTAAQALGSLGRAASGLRTSIPVSALVDLGSIPTPGRPARLAGPPINLLSTATNAIAIANGGRQVSVDLGPSVPGLLASRVVVTIGQRKQASGFVQVGEGGSTLRTSEIRALVEAGIALPVGSVTLPIYVEAARATATLASVTCPWSQPARREVALDVRPGVVDLAIAAVPASSIDLSRPQPSLYEPAKLVSLPLLSISGLARTTWDSPHSQRLTFTDDDIKRGRIRTVSSTHAVASLTSSLLGKLRLDVNGIDLVGGLALQKVLKPAFDAAAGPIDSVLDTVLRVLGIRIGYADATVDGTRCGQAVLVQ